EQFLWIAVVVGHRIWILDIEIVATRLYIFGSNLPSLRAFLAALALRAAPPVDATSQMLEADRLCHRIGFLALGHVMLPKPDVLGGLAFLEEQEIGADRGVGLEH